MHKPDDVEYDVICCLFLYEDNIFCRRFSRSMKLYGEVSYQKWLISCLLMMTSENLQEKIEHELHVSKAILYPVNDKKSTSNWTTTDLHKVDPGRTR